jgi:hypothetical protein
MSIKPYKGLETARVLLISYGTLALAYREAQEKEKSLSFIDGREPNNKKTNYGYCLSLLIINAAIIEGTLRSLLSERLLQDTSENSQSTLEERLLKQYRSEIEMKGGWENLKNQYTIYFNKPFNEAIGKDLLQSINVLFSLRNILSHGTTIVQPLEKMDDSMKDFYPYKWQTQLQETTVYLEKVFGDKDIFINLADDSMPKHFLDKTKELFDAVNRSYSPLPSRANETMEMLKSYSFGYMNA